MDEALMRIAVNAAAFFELSDDSVVDPDVAVEQLESIASELRGLSPQAKDALVAFVGAEAAATNDPRYRRFLLAFPVALGLRDAD